MVEGMGVPNDPGVGQAVEEDNHPERSFLPLVGLWQPLPQLPHGVSRNVDSRLLKDAPDKSRAIIAKIVNPTQTIGETDSRHDGFVEPGFGGGRIGKRSTHRFGTCEASGDLTRVEGSNERWLRGLPGKGERKRMRPTLIPADDDDGKNQEERCLGQSVPGIAPGSSSHRSASLQRHRQGDVTVQWRARVEIP
jgi:hypothetical protein